MKWLSMGHDIWNTCVMDGALGSCVKIMTNNMELYTVATVLKKHNLSHTAAEVAGVLEEVYKARYGISLKGSISHIGSDTTPSAKNVAKVLESEQDDCEMHVVNLVIAYALGIKENTRSQDEIVDGAIKRVHKIVTPGGEFKQGMAIIKAGRAIVNFFGSSPQRKHKLEAIRELYGLPSIQLTNYPDTRVSFASKLFQTLMANYHALKQVEIDDFKKHFAKLSPEDWQTMQEMEAICSVLSSYAVNEAQKSGTFLSSLKPFYRLALLAVANKKKFKIMDLSRQESDTKLSQIPRYTKRVDNFTDGGKKCLLRLQEQINFRLPATTPSQSLATLLDPATKIFARTLLKGDLYDKTLAYLKKEHLKVYKAWKCGKASNVNNDQTNTVVGPTEDNEVFHDPKDESSDKEDLVIETTIEEPNNGEEAVEQLLVDESNGIIDRWMSENPVSNKFVYIGSPCLPDKGGNIRIEQVIASFDTMEYYRKEGSIKYPTVTLLSRIHFARLDNAGFQERVFSTAKLVMSKEQSRMEFDMLEMRTLLCHNKSLISAGII